MDVTLTRLNRATETILGLKTGASLALLLQFRLPLEGLCAENSPWQVDFDAAMNTFNQVQTELQDSIDEIYKHLPIRETRKAKFKRPQRFPQKWRCWVNCICSL